MLSPFLGHMIALDISTAQLIEGMIKKKKFNWRLFLSIVHNR